MMLLQDVRDNKTEAASAAPQALRLCQMVGFTAPNFNSQMHHGSQTTISSQSNAICLMLQLKAADKCVHIVCQNGGLCRSYVAPTFLRSISTVKVVSKVAEQPVIARSKFGLSGYMVLYATLNQAQAQICTHVGLQSYSNLSTYAQSPSALSAFLAPFLPTCRTPCLMPAFVHNSANRKPRHWHYLNPVMIPVDMVHRWSKIVYAVL